ncbi:MAG: FAD-binding protein [Bacillota bacterium]
MNFKDEKVIKTDVLVIGSGGAGLRAALEARAYGAEVYLIDKVVLATNNSTRYSGGGFKAALPGILSDAYTKVFATPKQHFEAALLHGEYLNDQFLVETLCYEAPARILELQEFGVEHVGELYLKLPYPHGTGLVKPLLKAVKEAGCKTRAGLVVADLLVEGGTVRGVMAVDIYTGSLFTFRAGATVLASGGAGEVYKRNDTSANTTGDGFALAYRAGAELRDMEIIQFEPYVQAEPGLPMMDRHECEAEFYGILRNRKGEDFLPKYLPGGDELDAFHKQFGTHLTDIREMVARSMAMEVHAGRGDGEAVLFDLTSVPPGKWDADIASVYTRNVLLRGFDVDKKPVRVFPGAICNLGGVAIDVDCRTSLKGLFAAGEVTGGVHGAARLGGDALADIFVFGARAGRSAALYAGSNGVPPGEIPVEAEIRNRLVEILNRTLKSKGDPHTIKEAIKETMWRNVGLLRRGEGLDQALTDLGELKEKSLPHLFSRSIRELKYALEAESMLTVAEMIACSANRREESRGAHYRLDHPYRDDRSWLKNIFIRREGDRMALLERPVALLRSKPGPISKFRLEVKAL